MAKTSGSAFPHIKCNTCGEQPIRFGAIGKTFVVAVATMISSFGLMTYKVNASETEIEDMKKDIGALNRNIQKIDERARISESRDGLLAKQMNALLEANGITKRIEAPPVEPSTLETLEE